MFFTCHKVTNIIGFIFEIVYEPLLKPKQSTMNTKSTNDLNKDLVEVIILAGGLGTRIEDELDNVPKCLAPINKRPFLSILLNQLKENGLKNICIATGYMNDKVSEFLRVENSSLNIRISNEDRPLGTGGASKKAIMSSNYEHFLIMNGDTYFDVNLQKVINNGKGNFVVVTCSVPNVERYGEVVFDSKDIVTSFNEKGSKKKGEVNAGIYFASKNILDFMPNENFSLEKETFPLLIKKSLLFKATKEGSFIDIGTPESYVLAQREL